MMTKEEYKHELIRMWDSMRTKNKGCSDCRGVSCLRCPLEGHCRIPVWNVFKMIEYIEQWSKENPPKKYKVSKAEYDILMSVSEYKDVLSLTPNLLQFCHISVLMNMLKKGYFEGANDYTNIDDYINLCEVTNDE